MYFLSWCHAIFQGSYDRTIRIFDSQSGQSKQCYHAKRMQCVFTVDYTADSKFILSGSDDANVRIWKSDARYSLVEVNNWWQPLYKTWKLTPLSLRCSVAYFFFFLLVFWFLPSVTQCDAGTSQTTAAPETELHESIEEAVRAHERSQEHCSAPTRAKID